MDITLLAAVLRPLTGFALGGIIGLGFGLLQNAAQRRYRRRQDNGRLKTGWVLVPGSMSRVASLLIALVVAQAISPSLFTGGVQWWVSAGVAVSYSILLGWQLYHRRAPGPVSTASS